MSEGRGPVPDGTLIGPCNVKGMGPAAVALKAKLAAYTFVSSMIALREARWA
uniref:Uncharacterized protein n=1 Tax=Moniliophthora roreri TaxID=221103 RepID=A0A0W0FPW1_MONRR